MSVWREFLTGHAGRDSKGKEAQHEDPLFHGRLTGGIEMIGYKEGCVLVDGSIPVITREREICSANLLSVKAGTNGYQGGDSGHGSRTYFKIKDDGSTDLRVNVKKDMFGHTEEFEVVLGGDCELSTILTALKFIVHTLEEQIEEASGCV